MKKIIMPKLGLTMEEGTILRWHKTEGEPIEKGDLLFEVETDKAVNEVEATHSGSLGKILVNDGSTASVLQVIGYLLEKGENYPETWPESEMPFTKEERTEIPQAPKSQPRATPLALRLANETGIDLTQISGSGENGIINKEDILRFAEKTPDKKVHHRDKVIASPRAKRLAKEKGISLEDIPGTGPGGRIMEDDITLSLENQSLITPSRIQTIIAERLSLSFSTIPHFYLRIETDASELLTWRTNLLPVIENSTGVRLTFTDILLLLIAKTLDKHPFLNASWEKGKIRAFEEINIGIAAAIEDGLVVPVIKSVNKKGLAEIASERTELVEKAQTGKLNVSDLEGGTFTFTNLGMFGIDDFDAIINPPQSAILTAGQIMERPFAENGKVIAKPTLRLSLAIDHRVLDGAVAARFLIDLKNLIEAPGEILE